MKSGIQTSTLTESLIDFMMEMNERDDQRSFYFPDDRDETATLVREGAVPYVLFDKMHELSACAIADPVADNQTVEVSGPFGSTEARLKLIHKIKEDFPGYDVLLFLSQKNELCKHFTVLSEEYSMEISAPQKTDTAETTGKKETQKAAFYDAKQIHLHFTTGFFQMHTPTQHVYQKNMTSLSKEVAVWLPVILHMRGMKATSILSLLPLNTGGRELHAHSSGLR